MNSDKHISAKLNPPTEALYKILIAAVEAEAHYKEYVREDGSTVQTRSAMSMEGDYASSVADKFLTEHPETTAESIFAFIQSSDGLEGQYNIPFETIILAVHILNSLCAADESRFMALFQNKNVPWYAHKEALYCLTQRKHIEDWSPLENIIKGEHFESRVKADTISLIVSHQRTALLPVMQQQLRKVKPHEWDDTEVNHLVFGCAALGDIKVAPKLLALTENPWSHRHRNAQKALETLIDFHPSVESFGRDLLQNPELSGDEVWRDLKQQADGPTNRWGLANAPISDAQISDCIAALAHDDWRTRKTASNWFIAHSSGSAALRDTLLSKTCGTDARSWAAYTLLKSGELRPEDRRLIRQVPAKFQVDLGFEIPAEVRDSIIEEYAEHSEVGTDVRYKLEFFLKERSSYDTDEADRNRLIAALKTEGLQIKKCENIGAFHRQGEGTFWIIQFADNDNFCHLNVSTLGKFVSFYSKSEADGAPASPLHKKCRVIAETQGFFWVDPNVGEKIVPDLNVYFFGSRKPLSVFDLLFYWQD